METAFASTVVTITLNALVSVAMYIWFLVSGTRRTYDSTSSKLIKFLAFAGVMLGIFLVTFCVGTFFAMLWLFVFDDIDILLPFAVAFALGLFPAVVYTGLKEPRYMRRNYY